MQNAIGNVKSPTLRSALSATWATGNSDGFVESVQNWTDQGVLSEGEAKSLTRAAEKALAND